MRRHWICYLLFLLLSGILYIFYVGYTSWFIFTLVLIMPLCSLLLLILANRQFAITLQVAQEFHQKESASYEIHTKTWIPMSCVRVQMRIDNHFTQESISQQIELGVSGTQVHMIELSTDHIGMISITMEKVTGYDLLGLFAIRKKAKEIHKTLLLPKLQKVSETFQNEIALETGDIVSLQVNGNEDRFEVHPYQNGEPLHRIHWKLSAKQDEWLVREFGEVQQPFTALYFECCGHLADVEQTFSYVYSFSVSLLEKEIHHEMVPLYHGLAKTTYCIGSRQDLHMVMENLCATPCNEARQANLDQKVVLENGFYIQKDGIIPLKGGNDHD